MFATGSCNREELAMKRIALNVGAISRRRIPRISADARSAVVALVGAESVVLSRRRALGVAGALGILAAPAARAVESALSDSYRIVRRGQRIAIVVADVERWVLDPSMFDGSPETFYSESDDGIRLELRHARYPGTSISADIVAEISRGTTPVVRFTGPLFAAPSSAPLLAWLLERERYETTCAVRALKGLQFAAVLPNASTIRFRPTWSFTVDGRADVTIDSLQLPCDRLDVQLLKAQRSRPSSLLSGSASSGTFLRAVRGTSAWNIPLQFSVSPSAELEVDADAFDTCSLEVRSDGRFAGLLEGGREGASRFQLIHHDGHVGFRDVRYAWTSANGDRHEAFVARYASTPSWIRAHGIAFEISDREGLPACELVRRNGVVERFVVAPALNRYHISVANAATEPTAVPAASQLAFLCSAVAPSALPKPHFAMTAVRLEPAQQFSQQTQIDVFKKDTKPNIKVGKQSGRWSKKPIVFATNPRVTVIRPEDLLVLTFEFQNITLNKAAGTFAASGTNSRLIVHFQPQHIAERAFFYVTDDDTPKDKVNASEAPASAPKNQSGNEPRLDPPIEAIMAHSSRLVFSLPNGHSGKFSIEGLLDWSKLKMVVSPSAKPPDAEFVLSVLAKSAVSKFGGITAPKDPKPGGSFLAKKGKTSQTKTYALSGGIASKVKSSTKAVVESNADIATTISPQLQAELAAAILEKPPIREPKDDETAIEYPYRLFMSPNKYAAWAHSTKAKIDDERRAELWHTRLGVLHASGEVNENAAYFRTMRAIWTPDMKIAYNVTSAARERPFRTSINRRDRRELVQLMSDYSLKDTEVKPVDVKRFMMTSLGAWADMTGVWDPKDGELDVEQWIQRGTQGRDHFVRICYKGYLFPFGHRATLVKETERKFRRTPRGDMAAYLMQRMYIILRQPVRDYPAAGLAGMQFQGREFPFRRITITTKITPNLYDPGLTALDVANMGPNSFWPQFDANGPVDVKWSCIGTDWDNNEVHFSAPLAFIANTAAIGDKCQSWINNTYKNETARRTLEMGGQQIAYAASVKLGDTSLPTGKFTLHGYYAPEAEQYTPRFFPRMEKSKVRIEKVAELTGNSGERDVEFFTNYLKHAFEKGQSFSKGVVPAADQVKNPSQIFVRLVDKLGLDFGSQSDKAGGLAAPSLDISGLSRLMGPIAGDLKTDIEKTAAAIGNFDPMQYFESLLSAKILGDITLKDVLDFVMDVLNNLDKMPSLDKKDDFGVKDAISKAMPKNELLQALTDKIAETDLVKSAAEELNAVAGELDKDVKDARDALLAEIADLKSEINEAKNKIQSDVEEVKKAIEDRVNEWKKRLEDKANELKSEIEKAIKPLVDAGNEAYKKYEQAQQALNALKKGLNLSYEWQTEIKSSPGNILVPLYPGATTKEKKAILYLKASFTKKLDLEPPEILIYGSLSNFVINLIGDGAAQFLIIKFNRLAVSAKIGQKPDVDPDIEAVEFAGPLAFVNKLKDLIPTGGSAGGVGFSFDLNVNSAGITASLTIGLPNVTVGVFSLMNMSFLMSLTIPFDGRSFSSYFAFCTRENPFRLTIMMFGGGGFFGIEIQPSGVRMLEAAFEFGGNFAFDCGVASGGASVMAGVYYKLERKEIDGKEVEQSELTGYFRLTGNLSILGIIRVSLLFELKLTWLSTGKVFGTATIEVEIEILFISFSVGVTVERQLKGSDGDPTFHDMLPQASMWDTYCNAFA